MRRLRRMEQYRRGSLSLRPDGRRLSAVVTQTEAVARVDLEQFNDGNMSPQARLKAMKIKAAAIGILERVAYAENQISGALRQKEEVHDLE